MEQDRSAQGLRPVMSEAEDSAAESALVRPVFVFARNAAKKRPILQVLPVLPGNVPNAAR
jgi:hypothetical protein